MDLNVGRCLGLSGQPCAFRCHEFTVVRSIPRPLDNRVVKLTSYRLHQLVCVRAVMRRARMSWRCGLVLTFS